MQPTKYIWMDGELIDWDDATIHVLSHALHYGTAAFEGIRAYETDDGPAIFRLTEHIERLARAAKAVAMPIEWSVDEIVTACKEVFSANGLVSGYIRPLIFYGLGSIGLHPAGAAVHTMIATWEWGAYLGEDGVRNGIRVKVSSWRRIGHDVLMPNAKLTGGYVNSVLAKQEALQGGYDEAIMLNTGGFVAEGSGENLFVVRNGVVRTPPISSGVLDGLTRDALITMLREEGYEVIESDITRTDLYYADELFFSGTAAEVTPIREVDDRSVGDGRPGPVTRKAQQLYVDVVSGRDDRHRDWLDYV